jgi:UDP-N-acetylglucosamine 4,6-dehydratase
MAVVLFSFEHGRTGNLFENKAAAATFADLATAIEEVAEMQPKVRIIGHHHGEEFKKNSAPGKRW